jgi:large subunit ribosomal protein L24
MKKEFSTAWKSSKQPRKQRKYVAKAPLHIKRKLLSVNLSKDLRKKYSRRNAVVRKGDTVKIMNGKFKGKTGKILQVFTKKTKVTVDGIQVKKQDGSKANIKLRPSNLQITEIVTTDNKRFSNKKTESKENKTENKK